jgi:hypothetical protein
MCRRSGVTAKRLVPTHLPTETIAPDATPAVFLLALILPIDTERPVDFPETACGVRGSGVTN